MARRALTAAAGALAVALLAAAPAHALSKQEIVEMIGAGVSAEFVVHTIEQSGQIFPLGDEEVAELRALGIPEAVIRAMLGGKAPPAADALPEPAGAEDARRAAEEFRKAEEERKAAERRRAEEQRRRQAERLRAEAERLAQEAAAMAAAAKTAEQEAERRKTEIDRALREAFERLDRGDPQEAARRFHRFLRGGMVPPNSYRYVEGEYGLAESLLASGFVSGALPHYVEVLRRGTGTRRFAPALTRLGELTQRVVYDHPIFELLATFDLAPFPEEVRDEHAFFLGQFYARFGDGVRARGWFEKVSPRAARHPAARYHLGLIDVGERKFKTALTRFQEAAADAARRGAADLRDLAFLAMARVALENGALDGAAFYYDRIGVRSARAARARYERLWTLFMTGDHAEALGVLHALESPYFAAFLPDLRLLEATLYLNLCWHDDARAALREARAAVDPLRAAARKFLRARDDVGEHLDALAREPLPPALLAALDEDLEVAALRGSAAQVAAEVELLAGLGKGPLGDELRADLAARADLLRQLGGLAVRRALRDRQGELEELALRVHEVEFEVAFAEKEALLAETERLYQGGKAGARAPRPRRAAVPGQAQVWPFQGEFWEDEVDDYRSLLREGCR